jgi:hypothetical protein
MSIVPASLGSDAGGHGYFDAWWVPTYFPRSQAQSTSPAQVSPGCLVTLIVVNAENAAVTGPSPMDGFGMSDHTVGALSRVAAGAAGAGGELREGIWERLAKVPDRRSRRGRV